MSILDFLFPGLSCLGCRTELNGTKHLCTKCLAELPHNKKPVTLKSPEKQYFHDAFAPFKYLDPIVGVILSLKYGSTSEAAEFLAPHMADALQGISSFKNPRPAGTPFTKGGIFCPENTILVPVPLHKNRQSTRGYNQTLLLAKSISKILGFPVSQSLVRPKQTKIHRNMSARQRTENIRDAFAVTGGEEIANKTVILIDDVFTTGATVNECARTLLHSGVRRIYVLTAAQV